MATFQTLVSVESIFPETNQQELYIEFSQGHDLVQLMIPQLADRLRSGTDALPAIHSAIEMMVGFYQLSSELDINFQNDLKALISLSLRELPNASGTLAHLFEHATTWAVELAPEYQNFVADAIRSGVTEVGIDSFLSSFPEQQVNYGIVFQPLPGAGDPKLAREELDRALALIKLELSELGNAADIIILNGGRNTATELGVTQAFSLPASTSHGLNLSAVAYDLLRLNNLLRNIDLNPDQPLVIYDDGIDRGATLMKLLVEIVIHKGLASLEVECTALYQLMLQNEVMKDASGRLNVAQRVWQLFQELAKNGIHIVAAVDKLCGVDPVGGDPDAISPFFRLAQIVDIDDDPTQRRQPQELPWLMGRGGFDTKVTVIVDGRPLVISIGRNLPYLVRMDNPADNPIQKLQQLVIDFLAQQLNIPAERISLPEV